MRKFFSKTMFLFLILRMVLSSLVQEKCLSCFELKVIIHQFPSSPISSYNFETSIKYCWLFFWKIRLNDDAFLVWVLRDDKLEWCFIFWFDIFQGYWYFFHTVNCFQFPSSASFLWFFHKTTGLKSFWNRNLLVRAVLSKK